MQAKTESAIAGKLPPRLRRLEDIAYNVWWSWHRSARDLFKVLDRMLWIGTRHNPILILRDVSSERLAALAKDPAFLRLYDAVLMEMDRDIKTNGHWFPRTHPQAANSGIAYFSAEFGLHISLPIYSGGLGILSGDHLKEASDLGLPFMAVGFLYEQGYFRQRIDPNGWQQAFYPALETEHTALRPELDGGEGMTEIELRQLAYLLATRAHTQQALASYKKYLKAARVDCEGSLVMGGLRQTLADAEELLGTYPRGREILAERER